MEVVLLQDVKNVGKKGDVVNLKDGYARNLISKKQAAEASARVMNDLKLQKKHEEKIAEQRLKDALDLQAKLAGMSVTVSIKVGKDGKAFGSVSTKEIADACKKQLNLDVDKKKLVLPEVIKETGKYEVPLKLHPQVTGMLNVRVVGE
ncbi:MAG: 50S ribosomal protein L9 [Lachnospiraceae bacterium]|nr:50S ribosomal protein L9 [Lachnospiraceae bacterium]